MRQFVLLILAFAVAAPPSVVAADVSVEVNMDQNINRLWANMPGSGDSANVELVGDTQPDCATAALRLAKSAIATEGIAAGAWDSFTMTLDIVQDLMGLGGLGNVADAIEVTVAVVDGWPEPGNIVQNLGEVVAKKVAGTALGEATELWEAAADDDVAEELASIAGAKIAGAIYGELTKGDEKIKSTTCSYFCACAPVTIDFWVTAEEPDGDNGFDVELPDGSEETIGGFRLNMNVTTVSCNCQYGKPIRLQSYVVHASAPMSITATKVDPTFGDDYLQISLSVSGPGEFSVDAECCVDPLEDNRTSYAPLDDNQSGFFASQNASYPVSMNLPGMTFSGDTTSLCNFASWSQFIPFNDPSDLVTNGGDPAAITNPDPVSGGGLRPQDPTGPDVSDAPDPTQPGGQPIANDPQSGIPALGRIPSLDANNPFAITGITNPIPRIPTIPTASDDGDDPAPEPEEQEEEPAQTPPQITVEGKIYATAIQEGQLLNTSLENAVVQLDIAPPPPLPVAANAEERDTETGHNDPPITAMSDANGDLSFSFAAPVGYNGPASLQFQADMTPHDGRVLKLDSNQYSCGALGGLPSALQSIVSDCFESPGTPDGAVEAGTFVTLLYGDWWTQPGAQVLGAPDLSSLIASTPGLIYDEPAPCDTTAPAPNDPYFRSSGTWGQEWEDQWAVHRIGFTPDDESASDLIEGDLEPVIVGVIDTGLDWNHLDFSWDNIWNNPNETPGNRIDDDGNGYVDDVAGWDFIGRDNQPWDSNGHGTFVSGLIAAERGNGIGISGVAPNAKIMILRALDSFGHSRAPIHAKAILYAVENGARIINMSVEGPELTRTEQEAVTIARRRGVLVVISAGNQAKETSTGPAAVEGALIVSATDPHDERAVFSNWGSQVDIAAPGVDVLSLRARRTDLALNMPGVEYVAGSAFVGEDSRYYRSAGTSFAAPLVAATAAVILGRRPDLTVDEVERMILQSARDVDEPGIDRYTGYGLLDAPAAITADPAFFIESRIAGIAVAIQDGVQVVEVRGVSTANEFAGATIQIGAGRDPDSWKTVVDGIGAPVSDGTIGAIAAQEFAGSAQWTIRVVTTHANGRQREARYLLSLG